MGPFKLQGLGFRPFGNSIHISLKVDGIKVVIYLVTQFSVISSYKLQSTAAATMSATITRGISC